MKGFEHLHKSSIAKGIWMWSRPIETVVVKDEQEEKVMCLLLDCEGLEDTGKMIADVC